MRATTIPGVGPSASVGPITLPRTVHRGLYIAYDAVAICAALFFAIALRMNGMIPPAMLSGMLHSMPLFLVASIGSFHLCGLYKRVWPLGSLRDLTALVEAAILAVLIPVVALLAAGARWMPTSVPIIQCFVLVALLAGGRLWRRILADRIREIRVATSVTGALLPESKRRALIVGRPEHVEVVLRQLEAEPDPRFVAVGVIDICGQHVAMRLRNIPVLAGVDALEHAVRQLAARHLRPDCLILAEGVDGFSGPDRLKLVTSAQSLDLSVLRASAAAEIGATLDLEVMNFADLLGRPQTILDQAVVSRVVKGARVMVTGAGGTIGRELVRQVAALGPAEIILLDACEYNLYAVDLEVHELFPEIARTPLLVSIRQRQQVMTAFKRHRPEIVLHAAALKHVPMVEKNICAGVQTNVLGTRNIADAAHRYGVRAMVQVSTDKAVNPVGVMGATKRLGELYCQALDIEGEGDPAAARFMTVRFGNVLGSSGSLIPLFQRQLRQRVPLTVTHPDITRYFMTVHEAVQLVLHSMARALESDMKRGRIIVLDMGEPVKIIDIARRMIRLIGLEPDRDIPIKIVGLRPGEKLYEELFDEREVRLKSAIPGVFEAEPAALPLDELTLGCQALSEAISGNDDNQVKSLLFSMIEDKNRAMPEPAQAEFTPRPDPVPRPEHARRTEYGNIVPLTLVPTAG